MAKWRLDRPGVWEYLPLGFRAADGAILNAEAAPDGYWSLNADQGVAETVVRHTLGSLDPFDGGVPAQHAIPDHLDGGTPATQAFDPMIGGTP